jgi:hypothetical protein
MMTPVKPTREKGTADSRSNTIICRYGNVGLKVPEVPARFNMSRRISSSRAMISAVVTLLTVIDTTKSARRQAVACAVGRASNWLLDAQSPCSPFSVNGIVDSRADFNMRPLTIEDATYTPNNKSKLVTVGGRIIRDNFEPNEPMYRKIGKHLRILLWPQTTTALQT